MKTDIDIFTDENGFLNLSIGDNDIKISIRDTKALFIEINKHTYYIDDTTNEQIISKFKTVKK